MQISYKVASGGVYVVLADEADGTKILTDFQPTFTASVQENPLFRSQSQFRQPRSNVKCSWPLEFYTQYADAGTALASIRTVAALMGNATTAPQLLHFKWVEGVAPSTVETQYYPNGAVTNYKPVKMGVGVWHKMTITSDAVQATAP